MQITCHLLFILRNSLKVDSSTGANVSPSGYNNFTIHSPVQQSDEESNEPKHLVPKMIFRLNKEKEEEKEKSTKAAQVLFKKLQGLVFGLPSPRS